MEKGEIYLVKSFNSANPTIRAFRKYQTPSLLLALAIFLSGSSSPSILVKDDGKRRSFLNGVDDVWRSEAHCKCRIPRSILEIWGRSREGSFGGPTVVSDNLMDWDHPGHLAEGEDGVMWFRILERSGYWLKYL
ncbi:hypothetical protein JTE90_013600 [Oedothorax gibbosus]|uniref:Uncharacterized protein n=1 Tax=Oedothorax gibbosus TaxID=931172 RepID=A0AAV6VGB9_9ARAC|nr:hypothetical protein JTE90_013600 [Oedothorax gibbosus]